MYKQISINFITEWIDSNETNYVAMGTIFILLCFGTLFLFIPNAQCQIAFAGIFPVGQQVGVPISSRSGRPPVILPLTFSYRDVAPDNFVQKSI